MRIQLKYKITYWQVIPDTATAIEQYMEARPDKFEDILFPNLTYFLEIKCDQLYLVSAYDEKSGARISSFDLEKIAFHLGIKTNHY